MRSSHSSDEDRRLQGRRRSGAPSPGLRRSPALPAPLHLQSRHSLLRGVVPIEELAARAGRYGYGAFCVADRNNLYGSVCAWRAARAAGLKAIIGAELDDGAPEGAARRGEPRREEPRTALLLARDRAGYARLCRAVTRRKLAEREGGRGEAPGFDLVETIAADPTGLFILTENPELAGGLAARLGRHAREALFVELSRPVASVARERRLLHAAQSLGLSVVAGGATPFLDAPDASFHHLLEAMRTLSTVRRVAAGAPAPPANRLLPPRALADLYRDLPQALETSARIARECRVDFDPDRH
ncbi:MAG: PHP domain-containing protein, partial [Planctomycetota bacterium]